MLLTSLPATAARPARVIEMYRARWQVELSFKRLQTLGGIDRLPSADPRLARTWLLAHLIVAVLNDELAGQIIDFSSSVEAAPSLCDLAVASLANGTTHSAARYHADPA
jgi:IS4 transposase